MNWPNVRRLAGLLLLAASLAVLVWGLWPLPDQARRLVISPEQMRPAELPAGQATGSLPALAAPRLLLLEWPPVVRAGDLAAVRLVLDLVEPQSSVSQASPAPGQAYTVVAEARLELPGLRYAPPGEVSQALLPARPLTFVWDLLPVAAGRSTGTVWLHLRFIPASGGPEQRQLLTAQRIQVRVIDLLGLSGPWARALGSAGIIVGAVLCLDGVALWLWSRLER